MNGNGNGNGLLRGIFGSRKAVTEAQAAEQRAEERKRHRAALEAATAREPGLEALREKEERVRAVARAEVAAAQRARESEGNEIARSQSAAILALRGSCDPLITDSGPVVWGLIGLREHLREHMSLDVDNLDRVWLRDVARLGGTVPEKERGLFEAAKRRVQLHDAAAEVTATVDRALSEVRELQLEAEPDLPAVLAEILGGIPTACPCGEPLNFADVVPLTRPTRSVRPAPALA